MKIPNIMLEKAMSNGEFRYEVVSYSESFKNGEVILHHVHIVDDTGRHLILFEDGSYNEYREEKK